MKIILDLCGGTGSWSKPYADAGYDVINVTLPVYNVKMVKFISHELILESYDWGMSRSVPIENVYGVLAAPPCTMFSIARTTAKEPRDLKKGMEIVRACMDIIWTVHPHFWAMENPVGILRQFIGKPTMTFQPYMFGDRYMKRTDLWGYFNEPKKCIASLSDEQLLLMKDNNREMPQLPEDYILPEGENKYAARRAMTPQGFAQAFFKANP